MRRLASALSRFVKRERTLSAANFCTVLENLGLDLVIVSAHGGGYIQSWPSPISPLALRGG